MYAGVAVTFAKQRRTAFIRQLLGCMKDSGLCSDQQFDDVIVPCVDVMYRLDSQSKEVEEFIKMLRSDVNKVRVPRCTVRVHIPLLVRPYFEFKLCVLAHRLFMAVTSLVVVSPQINAYMQCGRLKSAYMLAVKTQRVDVVRAIGRRAEQLGQTAVKHICDKWLQQRRQ